MLCLLPKFDEGLFDHLEVQEIAFDFLKFAMNVDEKTIYLGSFSDEMVLDVPGREEAICEDFDRDDRFMLAV